MTDPRPQSYALGRDHKASIRLNYQHWLVREQIGFLLERRILDKEDIQNVADVGAGTCLWITETARLLATHRKSAPSRETEFHAFDISATQYPPSCWLPTNVHLHEHDALQPFPPQYRGQFDVVHVQFLLVVVPSSSPEIVIENLIALLKPGGYIQWLEGDPTSSKVIAGQDGISTKATQTMLDFLKRPGKQRSYTWVQDMPRLLSSAGLSAVTATPYPIRDELRSYWNAQHLMIYEEFATQLANSTEHIKGGREQQNQEGNHSEATDHLENFKAVQAEFGQGVSIDANLLVFVAKKD